MPPTSLQTEKTRPQPVSCGNRSAEAIAFGMLVMPREQPRNEAPNGAR